MSITERKQKERKKLKKKIIESAKKLFIKYGYENVSMRKIAKDIDYSPTTIYIYFENKSDLIFSIVQEFYKSIEKEISKVFFSDHPPFDKLIEILTLYVKHSIDPKNHYDLILKNYDSIKTNINHTSGYPKGFNIIKEPLEDCVKNGLFKEESNIDLILQGLWAINFGLISLFLAEPNFDWVDKEKLIYNTIRAFLKGNM